MNVAELKEILSTYQDTDEVLISPEFNSADPSDPEFNENLASISDIVAVGSISVVDKPEFTGVILMYGEIL